MTGRILIQAQGNAQSRYVAVSCDVQNFIREIAGHEILTFGYNEGVDILIGPEDDFSKVVRSLPDGWTPDFCLLWQAEWNLLPRGIESAPFPVAAYISDWDYDIPLTRTIIETADLVVIEGDFDEEAVLAMGAGKVLNHYALGVMEEYLDPSPRGMADREFDVSYTVTIENRWYADKARFILDLCLLPDKYKVLVRKPAGSYSEYISMLRNSKLVISHVRRGLMSVRTLEAGAQGTVCLNTGTEVEKHFVAGKEYIPVTHDNFLEQTENFLKDIDVLQKMSDKVRNKAKGHYTSGRRFSALAEGIGEMTGEKGVGHRKFGLLPESERHIRRGEVFYYTFFRSVAAGYRFKNIEQRKFLALAVEEFEKAVAMERSAGAVTKLAVAVSSFNFLFKDGKAAGKEWDRTISMLKEVISSHPEYAMAHYNLGLLHFRLGNLDEAARVLRTALKVFEDKDKILDPWCLQTYDFDLFNSLLQRPLNENLLLLFTEREKALDKIRDLYRSATLYYIFKIARKQGDVYMALEALLEARTLNPGCALIAKEAAELSAMLGHEKEGLDLYKNAVEISPLDIDLRNEYIKVLYLYGKDRDVVEEIRKVLSIIKRVAMLSDKSVEVNDMISKFTRFDASSPYSHDAGKEDLLGKWLNSLYDCLRKNPLNSSLVLRIVTMWSESGREEMAYEILGEYIMNCRGGNRFDGVDLSLVENAYDRLQKASIMKNKGTEASLARLHGLVCDMRAALTAN
ncbi:MAG: tetratricopeptide repeat protein [Nitrospirae bacterium]|nr:tetratricopeptide repeat protein [Nitrospirota bacterium]